MKDCEADNFDDGYAACILELRARIEALEANSSAGLTSSNYLGKPDTSPVERVARAIGRDDEPVNWEPEARAAIREVAAWLKEHGYAGWSILKQEAQ